MKSKFTVGMKEKGSSRTQEDWELTCDSNKRHFLPNKHDFLTLPRVASASGLLGDEIGV